MNYFFSKPLTILILILFCANITNAQKNNIIWAKISKDKISKLEKLSRKSEPKKAVFLELDLAKLKAQLINAPLRGQSLKTSNLIIEFPDAEGNLESFRVKEAPVMVPEMQVRHTNIRSYVGQSIETPSTLIRFSVTPLGLHTMTLSSKNGTLFIDPYTKDLKDYIAYYKKDLPLPVEPFECGFIDEKNEEEKSTNNRTAQKNADDGMMREYRLALACTAEYGNYHGGNVTDIKSAMAVTMTRVNAIYERELSITMLMVENENIIYFGDVDVDPYTNDNGITMLEENQTEIDTKIGETNYDIGHVFSTGGGGIAGLGVVCVWAANPPQARRKARGVTGLTDPVGDIFDVDYVAHEMGHQFGANHTFNSTASNCGGQRNASTAYEPGSGSTIMAYAGICSPENIQQNSNDYFHQVSLQEIWAHVNGAGACAVQTSTGNSAPTANAGGNYSIPISTPYKLIGSSTDTDGTGTHTYTWEEYDLTTNTSLPSESSTEGPIVRSLNGTTSPIRYIPRLADLRSSNGSTMWEKLSSVIRDINFQLTVRDNDINGGQTAADAMTVSVTNTAGPFLVTSQNMSGISWIQNASEEITWDTANTDTVLGVSMVNILLSTDDGLTYPINLTPGGTANDGAEIITVPNILAPYCRVMVEAVGNIFFAINTVNFAIGYNVTNTCYQYSQNPNFAIPDDGSSLSQFNMNVLQSGKVTDVNVGVDVTHTYIGDLQVSVLSPDGTQVNLLTPTSSCAAENLVVKFDDSGDAYSCSLAPNNLVLQSPNGTLSDWIGEESSGTWIFGIGDFGADDVGTLNSWSLEICVDVATPLGVEDFNLTGFSVFPNPNKGEFTVKLNSVSNELKIEVFDISGRSLFYNSYKNTTDLNKTINLVNANSGVYLVKVSDGDRSGVKKIIID